MDCHHGMAWETQKAQMQASPLFISYNDEAGAYLYQVVPADRILTKGKFVKE